jgi:hypothetical protein
MERLEYPDTTGDISTLTTGTQGLVSRALLLGAEITQYGVGLTRSLVLRIAHEFLLRNMDYTLSHHILIFRNV